MKFDKPPFIRTAYNYDTDAASAASGLLCPEPTLTKQSFKEECDINTIVERFGIGYEMPQGVQAPVYGDFTGVRDFQSAINAIAQARESFSALPGEVRARFRNDPQAFVEFCSDDKNRPEAEDLGLVFKRPAVNPGAETAAPAVNSVPEKAP